MVLTDEQKKLIKKRCEKGHWGPIDGQYSALDNSVLLGKCEGVIHEVAHGIVLGLYLGEIGSDEIGIQLDKLADRTRHKPGTWRKAWEWNEVRTQAVSILALRMIGYKVTREDIRALCKGAASNMESYYFEDYSNVRKEVLKLLSAKKTARYASKVINALLGDELPTE